MEQPTIEPSVAEIWDLFRETAARFKETDAKFKETDAKFKETDAKFKETDAKFKETDAKFKETDEQLNQLFRETKEIVKQTTTNLQRLEGIFGNQWGKLVEALVQPSAIRLFRERGIDVHHIAERVKSRINGRTKEIDLVLENTDVVLAVEIKTTLHIHDVDDFLTDLAEFRQYYPRYKYERLYGAVAGLDIVEEADRYAYRRGLYVLQVSGEDTVQILNDQKFKPRNFAS